MSMQMRYEERARLATLVAHERERLGMSREELAEKAEVALKTIANIERGDHVPQEGTLIAILETLGLNAVRHVQIEIEAREDRLAKIRQLEQELLENKRLIAENERRQQEILSAIPEDEREEFLRRVDEIVEERTKRIDERQQRLIGDEPEDERDRRHG